MALSGIATTQTISVTIGSANPTSVFLTANPQRITQPRHSTISAYVFGNDGNPVSNVPVFFSVSLAGGSLEESMDSSGTPIFTDNNGRAVDILRTSYDPDAPPKTVTVHAEIPTGLSDDVDVIIN